MNGNRDSCTKAVRYNDLNLPCDSGEKNVINNVCIVYLFCDIVLFLYNCCVKKKEK